LNEIMQSYYLMVWWYLCNCNLGGVQHETKGISICPYVSYEADKDQWNFPASMWKSIRELTNFNPIYTLR
jgi:hypothetical protein